MDARQFQPVRGISLAALTSLIVGVTAFGIVIFLLILSSNDFMSDSLNAGLPAIPGNLLTVVVTLPGIGFLLALAGIIAGFSASPEKDADNRTQTCKWICRLGIGLSLVAIFINMLIISYLRILAETMGLA